MKMETDFILKLKNAEEQIRNKEIEDAEIVFKEMKEKYGY